MFKEVADDAGRTTLVRAPRKVLEVSEERGRALRSGTLDIKAVCMTMDFFLFNLKFGQLSGMQRVGEGLTGV